MKRQTLAAAALITLSSQVYAQEDEPVQHPSPNAIVDAAEGSEWVAIPQEDLVVMTLAPAADGSERRIIIQLMPAPFGQGWVSNIRTLARAKWYDGITVNRVQDNYVVQWGDAGHDNPESGETETKPLPEGLKVMGEDEYLAALFGGHSIGGKSHVELDIGWRPTNQKEDPYAGTTDFFSGWPITWSKGSMPMLDEAEKGVGSGFTFYGWPIHCYGMVGVGRDYSPDTGSGAELYTVIGHAPRHLDRNIALVGRIISGMEHLSSLPRGSGVLGFYTEEEKGLRTPIVSVRVASDLPEAEQPLFEYLSTESESFAQYAEARANRRDPFFIVPAGGADICNIPVPIREMVRAEGSLE